MRFWHGLAALSIALAPASALAKCAAPSEFLVPSEGDLPSNPALHLFLPFWKKDAPDLTVKDQDGNPLQYEIKAVTSSPAFDVLRIDVVSAGASSISLSFERGAGRHLPERTFRIDPRYASAPRSAARIESVTESSYQWTCSREELQQLQIDTAAPLYRVEWAASESDFRAGNRKSVLLPHRLQDLAFNWNENPVPATALLALGQINCTGSTFDWTQGPVWVAVVAMYPDGSETPLGEPALVKPPSSSRGKSPNWNK
jgi:hypothetical protein